LLVNRKKITQSPADFYDIADNCIDKKTLFATDILYYSSEDYTEWQVPDYIKEGKLIFIEIKASSKLRAW
jgi:hypothetical protein